jgi:cytochrome c-type biogenesis protein CcmF
VYKRQRDSTTESAIYTHYLHDLYVVIGSPTKEDGFAVRIFYKPFMNLIWLGVLVMSLGGFVRLILLLRRKH